MAAGMGAMSVGLINSLSLEAQTTGGGILSCTSGSIGDVGYFLCDYKKKLPSNK